MITPEEYFGPWTSLGNNPSLVANATELLKRVNRVLDAACNDHVLISINPTTRSQVSGNTFGGIRPLDCPIGSNQSAHKRGMAVDVYDPVEAIDKWLTDAKLELYDLYREHPNATRGWCHLSTRRPDSGHRTFYP